MSDLHPDGSLPELTPEQESEVRRLLADARHDEPIPAQVGDRLDAVLAGLSRDEPGSEGVAPVIDLAARRRRRNAAAVLAGAAAVIVAGFGIGQIIDVGSEDDSGTSSAAVNADRGSSADDQAESQFADGGASSPATPAEGVPGPAYALEAPLRLRSGHLESDITRQLLSYTEASAGRTPDAKAFNAAGCPLPPQPHNKFGLGELYPALFDDTPAVLAVRPPADGSRQADVLDCTTADALASVTLPSR
jgi:hypothetical protein